MGNLPFFESRRILLASDKVTPCEAVTRVVVITDDKGVEGSWNCTSREVTIPTSLPPSEPVSRIINCYYVLRRKRGGDIRRWQFPHSTLEKAFSRKNEGYAFFSS